MTKEQLNGIILLSKMESGNHISYFFGEFKLDLARGGLYRRNRQLWLRPKSFDVLKYLVQNCGRLVAKKEVIRAVWADSFVTDDSLVQCMIEVRRTIGPESAKLIKTVPGRGYLFNGEVQERISGGKGSFVSEWSIAVLAFKHIAGERDESLEIGIADALIIKLSSLRQLTVRPTIAVRKDADPLKVGQKLGVRAVLTGSILRSGKRLRITGQLLETEHGTLLWADKFDQTFTDLFSVQDSICERVAAGLESTLLGREPEPLVKRFHA